MRWVSRTALTKAVRVLLVPMARQRHVKRLTQALLGRVPAFARLLAALADPSAALPPRRMHVPLDSNDLSPATHALYQELKRHFESRKS